MKKIICLFILTIPLLCSSQTRIMITGFSEYDSWTHMDPFYLDEPAQDLDNMRPVEYEERNTHIRLSLDSQLMKYWIGYIGARLNFVKSWLNRKHIADGDEYFEYSFPMTPYQTRSDYLKYGLELYYGGCNCQQIKPYIGFGGEFKIEEITSTFIYIDNQTNAAANPYASIPVDEHIERRFNYYAVAGIDLRMKNFYVGPQLRLYFSEIEIDEKMMIRDRHDDAQLRPMIELGFIF